MSYRVIASSVKPAGVKWFSEVNPNSIASYIAWLNTFAGVVSITKSMPNENTIVRTYVFENEVAYTTFAAAHDSNADNQLRRAYNNTNGITTTLEFLDA